MSGAKVRRSTKAAAAASSSSSSSSSSSASVYLLVAIGLMVLFGLYYWFKVRPGLSGAKKHQISRKDVLGVPDTAHRAAPPPAAAAATAATSSFPAVVPPEKALTTMYVPKEVGHRTGHQRVFITNKGLRVYETNEHGWPMPPPTQQASLISQTPQ